MRTDIKIDFVAQPMPEHVFPQLQLAKYAKSQGLGQLRFYSCPSMRGAAEEAGIDFLPVLADREEEVLAIAAHHAQVMDSFVELIQVVDQALTVQEQFENELRKYWKTNRPDLVVIDYLSPFAGVVADELGIPWWTVATSTTTIESATGTPTYLGGLAPPKTIFGKWRDTLGRWFIRGLKKFTFVLFRKKMRPLGFTSVYREDGTERMYSNDVILGLGIGELEFEDRDLPKAWRWIGPCLERPVLDHHVAAYYEPGKKHILVAPGTQVRWARERAEQICREVARHMPDCVFHFVLNVLNDPELKEPQIEDNMHIYGYIPFTSESFRNYDVVFNMGGIGVMYTAIAAGIPQLALPQSFEQLDCAARIFVSGLGLRSSGEPRGIAEEFKKLLENDWHRKQAHEYREIIERYNPGKTFVELVQKKFAK
jgi:UDP:flavonoid glycosyltransferase YjiC (YdhE family)